MYKLPPSHPRYKLIGTEKTNYDINILIYDSKTYSNKFYSQKEVRLIKDLELKSYLFSVRKYINEGRYEI